MKHLKLYEQFDFDDLSDEELFGSNRKGPYDDILIYGNDGPEFKAGDRVIFLDEEYPNIFNKIGTIVKYNTIYDNPFYLVCFDDDIKAQNVANKSNIPLSHGLYVRGSILKKLD